MISNKILLLKQEATLKNGLKFPARTEFHIVMDVVYMQGFPLPANLQATLYNWIAENPRLFTEIFK
jgi:hypothetical protein